jgi:hypothetical protein
VASFSVNACVGIPYVQAPLRNVSEHARAFLPEFEQRQQVTALRVQPVAMQM